MQNDQASESQIVRIALASTTDWKKFDMGIEGTVAQNPSVRVQNFGSILEYFDWLCLCCQKFVF